MAKVKQAAKVTSADFDRHAAGMKVVHALGPIEAALKPLDQVAAKMEGKWGCGRLLRLVSPATAAKFASAQNKLDEAILDSEVELVTHRAAVVMRGWQAMDAEAEGAGQEPLPKGAWSLRQDGKEYTVVLDRRDCGKIASLSLSPERVVSLDELLFAWSEWRARKFAEATKALFPGAQVVTEPKAKSFAGGEPDDEIPF